jgi:hypothetical protein
VCSAHQEHFLQQAPHPAFFRAVSRSSRSNGLVAPDEDRNPHDEFVNPGGWPVSEVVRMLLALWMLHPTGVRAPVQDAAHERVRRVRTVLASTLDPVLPEIPLDSWIRQVVGATARYRWDAGFCEGTRERLNSALPICGAVVATRSDTIVTVSVRLGERASVLSPDRWGRARVEDAFVDRGTDSLTLERLSDLPRMLTVPPQQWPKPDLALDSAVQCSPSEPRPGQSVTCTASVVNRGKAPAHARVFLEVQPDYWRFASGSENVVTIRPGVRKTVKWTFDWLSEFADISVGVELIGPGGSGRRPIVTEKDLKDGQVIDAEIQTMLAVRGTLTRTTQFRRAGGQQRQSVCTIDDE